MAFSIPTNNNTGTQAIIALVAVYPIRFATLTSLLSGSILPAPRYVLWPENRAWRPTRVRLLRNDQPASENCLSILSLAT